MKNWFKRLFLKKNNQSVREGINVVESIGKAKILYKELIRLAHPDRNPNNEEYARELTDRINANRYNYKELLKIQQEISNEKNA
jgi:hypothetical protein